jgi:hypothetical protein
VVEKLRIALAPPGHGNPIGIQFVFPFVAFIIAPRQLGLGVVTLADDLLIYSVSELVKEEELEK